MLNMKKGLAIVLAAATALTFAPVSTLGLTGVVEAKAATATPITGATAAEATDLGTGVAFNSADTGTWTGAADAFAKAQATLGTDGYYFIELTGADASGTDYTYSINTEGSAVTRFGDGETDAKGKNSVKLLGAGTANTTVVAFKASSVGTAKVTIVNDMGTSATTDDKTLTINFTVNGPVSSDSKVSFTDAANKAATSINLKTSETTAAVKAKVKVTGKGINDGDSVYYKIKNSAVVQNASGGDSDTLTLTNGSADLSLKATATQSGSYTDLDVYASEEASAVKDAKPLATLHITVEDTQFKVTTKPLARGKEGAFTYVTGDNTNSITIKVEKTVNNVATDVTKDFIFFKGDKDKSDGLALDPATGIASPVKDTTNYLWVKPVDAENGTYTITLTQNGIDTSATFEVKDSVTPDTPDDNNNKPVTPATADKSAVFGGVITNLYATDNTSYNLVSSDAEFELNGTRYTANQLKWYLTKAPTKTPENMGLTTGAGSIAASTTGKLNVTVSNAEQFAIDINGTDDSSTADNAYIVGVYTSGADNTIVYSHPLLVEHADKGYVTKNYDAGTISTSVNAIATADPANQISDSFLNGVKFIGVNNKYLKGKDIDSLDFTKAIYNGTHFDATLAKGGNDDEVLKGSKLTAHAGEVVRDGVYYETFYVPYTEKDTNGKFVAAITVKVSVSAGPVVEIKEGNFTYSLKEADKDNQALRDQKVIDLDLTTNKTFDIAAHAVSNKDNTSYAYDPDTQNVTVDAKGVVTAAKVGTAVVKVTPTANGVAGASVYVFFRVNKNANDQISVTGKDGDKATVLTTRQYNANINRLSTEEGLAKAQVGYVQIEVTGDETADVKEDLTVKGNGTLSFSLANDPAHKESVDAKTGQITIPHEYLNNYFKDAKAGIKPFVFPVKVVSTETNSSALTTGYFYVVVDYADASITGLEDSYNVGTSIIETGADSWLNLGTDRVYESNDKTTTYVPVHVSSNADIVTSQITKNDDLDDSKIYDADDSTVFINNYAKDVVRRAIVSGKTEHVLVSADDTAHKVGHTYKVVTINSVAGQNNYVKKIENVETGKTVYQQGAGVNSGASIVINKPTVVKVTVAHAPSATLNANYDPAFTISRGGNEFNYNTDNLFVAATENPNTYEITLIPSAEGTQIVSIYPTEGRLSESDYSLVKTDAFNLAVKYSTADSKTPAQVKGVKVGNKKGAKVVVKFTKDTTDKNIKYYVQKKVGKKTSGKSVGSNRTILSVKKGATVKVRVKAYYYDANGLKHVGKYSKWVTKKTDKK